MKTSELIAKLQALVERDGDSELLFLVSDHYSVHGQFMHPHWRSTDPFWTGTFTRRNGGGALPTLIVNFSITDKVEDAVKKRPKITYRK